MKKFKFYLTLPSLLLILLLSFQFKFSSAKELIEGSQREKFLNDDSLALQLRSKITALKLKGFELTGIQLIRQASYTPKATNNLLTNLPPFCLISANLKPTVGSLIRIELWLPLDNWNGRLLGTGNGGGAGSIAYESLAGGIRHGYATVNTDMGTSRGGANAAVDNPEVWKDFGYRATHEMTVVAKHLVKMYYGKKQHHSYFVGCSTGGQQGLMEAQRFPNDYNGIIAGAPANNRTHLHTSFLWNYAIANKNGKALFTKEDLAYISKQIIDNYTVRSGGAPKDDFLTNPGRVDINVDSLFGCKQNSGAPCLGFEKMEALKKIYKGPVNPQTHAQIYTSFPLGSENIGGGLALQQTKAGADDLFYLFKWAFGKDFDPMKFDFDKDVEKLDLQLAPLLNANNPDLSAYKKNGGKIIMYTGTADPLVPYQDAANYYNRVVAQQKGLDKAQTFFKYYLLPGMAHCAGGPGLNGFSRNILVDLVDWVEKAIVPNEIVAAASNCCDTNGPPRLQRPVYPYPQFAKYTGGDINLVSSYIGVADNNGKLLVPAAKYLK